ncbi:hypothetical protein AB0M28_23910 [Streptomyces sp. NPDC051940]|uniref:hypothetical protein n=1 Tax=Streptomyces sp. NPDC051940 TaxID=3155675 RepID=UPI00343646B2
MPRFRAPAALCALAAAVLLVTGCGGKLPDPGGTEGFGAAVDPDARMREVAAAWEGTEVARNWRDGYYPLGEAEVLPEGAWRNGDDKIAHLERRFVLRGPQPPKPPARAEIRWDDGKALQTAVLPVESLYPLAEEGSGGTKPLVITRVELGEIPMATSRGPARVPAWLLTVEGYATPIQRSAVDASDHPEAPVKALDGWDSLEEVRNVRPYSADSRTLTVDVLHGACDKGPRAYLLETGRTVVVRGDVESRDPGPCEASLHSTPVTVELTAPVGDRILLDAVTGLPLSTDRPRG